MANRILKESINESNSLAQCSIFAQDLYKRLITYADDYGRFNADTQIMLARLYPRELDTVSHSDVIEALIELRGNDKIQFYTSKWSKNDIYGAFPNWSKHQRVRDSKRKYPDPDDLVVNEWYLKRFISISMKEKIIIRDKFKCQICGKNVSCGITDAKKLLKMSMGIFHFDHIVPHGQGGRATMENIRLSCAKCNQARKKTYTFDEIVAFTLQCGEIENVAANCGELRPNPIQSNPIQSNPNPIDTSDKPTQKRPKFTKPSLAEIKAYCQERHNEIDAKKFFDYYESANWTDANGKPVKNWKQKIITWEGRQSRAAPEPKREIKKAEGTL